MTKFDHAVNLPDLFIDNRLSILPISRGEYIIAPFSAYKEIEEDVIDAERVSIPPHLQSLQEQFLTSESVALNCAVACGIIDDFLEDEQIVPTVSGRMGSGEFDFNIATAFGSMKRLEVRNSQIEIDAAFEGIKYLSLIEAKCDFSEDFLIRQLYYPFRVWKNRITKPIKSIFFTFSNGCFEMYQYDFTDPMNYNSLYIAKRRKYIIDTDITVSDIEYLLNVVPEQSEPDVPFPQADKFSRLVMLMERLQNKAMTNSEITAEYAFDERQADYYANAGKYLGLIEKCANENGETQFRLSSRGNEILSLPYQKKQLEIVRQIISHSVFRKVLQLHLQTGEMPSKDVIVDLMKTSNLYNIEAEETYRRRSSTVMSWVAWILALIKE